MGTSFYSPQQYAFAGGLEGMRIYGLPIWLFFAVKADANRPLSLLHGGTSIRPCGLVSG